MALILSIDTFISVLPLKANKTTTNLDNFLLEKFNENLVEISNNNINLNHFFKIQFDEEIYRINSFDLNDLLTGFDTNLLSRINLFYYIFVENKGKI